jgi:hypothetical protein
VSKVDVRPIQLDWSTEWILIIDRNIMLVASLRFEPVSCLVKA